jgi:hypothetical protein
MFQSAQMKAAHGYHQYCKNTTSRSYDEDIKQDGRGPHRVHIGESNESQKSRLNIQCSLIVIIGVKWRESTKQNVQSNEHSKKIACKVVPGHPEWSAGLERAGHVFTLFRLHFRMVTCTSHYQLGR